MDIGHRIAAWLQIRGITQRALARKVGVSPGAVTAWIKGDSDPTHKNLTAVIEAFGLTWAEFFGGVPKAAPSRARRARAAA